MAFVDNEMLGTRTSPCALLHGQSATLPLVSMALGGLLFALTARRTLVLPPLLSGPCPHCLRARLPHAGAPCSV